ncbi:MAG: RlmE family RNA methyltransferase [Treponema sp.]|nr:RlmE family RNA methyltransferase [Treponema sp.]
MANYSKPDHWSLKAQKEGYPARSVYKLMEIDEKFNLLRYSGAGSGRGIKVLELGAAPGSWSLYLLRKFCGSSGLSLVSVDLCPLSRQYDRGLFDRPELVFIQGDFTLAGIRETIESHGPFNLIISDAAPATTGIRSVDTLRSLELAETALSYAHTALANNGNMAVKVFQGGDTGNFLKSMRDLFKSAKSFKPQACRSESFETYFLGLGKK